MINDQIINAPSQIWASDFTYLSYFNNKFLYIATIIDCFTKEIIAWNLSSKHNAGFIIEALNDAINKKDPSQKYFTAIKVLNIAVEN